MINATFDLKTIRTLYDAVCDAIQYWPGSPARPPEQQEEYQQLKVILFSMLCECSIHEE
jgi:hypothetical protein